MNLTITMCRHNWIWHVWQMLETHDDGRSYLIAQGQAKRKKTARAQADAWYRLYERQRRLHRAEYDASAMKQHQPGQQAMI